MSECAVEDTVYACLRPENMTLSKTGINSRARNSFKGSTFGSHWQGDGISKVKIMIEPTVVTSVIASEAVDKLGIKEGNEVFAIVKSTKVMIGKKSRDL